MIDNHGLHRNTHDTVDFVAQTGICAMRNESKCSPEFIAVIDFFYPKSTQGSLGGRFWRGFQGLWDPCIPSRLFSHFFRLFNKAMKDCDKDSLIECIQFLEASHMKFLSQAGRGDDVLCAPALSLEGAKLMREIIQ
jgi:hypothetical protein